MTEQKDIQHNSENSLQLDLEFNQIEPVMPKKMMHSHASIIQRLKNALHTLPTRSSKKNIEQDMSEQENQEDLHTDSSKKNMKFYLNSPEHWGILGFIPPKYRRVFIALLITVFLLFLISWLKPSPETVIFNQATNEIPTQFQSLYQNQSTEEHPLDNLTQQLPPKTTQEDDLTMLIQKIQQNNSEESVVPQDSVNKDTLSNITTSDTSLSQPTSATSDAMKKKEMRHISEKVPLQHQTSNETNLEKNTPQTAKSDSRPPITEAKPAAVNNTVLNSGVNKTLIIPQGASLMQVFRNNNLNISDVNAMTKAKGVGNTLSNFKPGDKVQVYLNAQGRVAQLRLSNGATFIRQANGTYQYKK
ncbi:LysM-like peptidoglycan-binding domain-containing protein [Avibacterium paragallinarum]